MASNLGLTPSGAMPYAQTPVPQTATPSPADTSAQISGTYNYSGVPNTQQSFQAVNMFRPGFGPDPRYMTPSQYGIFRPQLPPPPAVGSGILPSPMYPYPPMPAMTQFTPPGEFAAGFALQEARHAQVQNTAFGMSATRLGFAGAGGFFGSAMGAAAGAAFGGPGGMRAGAMIGGVAGTAAMGFSHAGQFATNVIWSTPLHNSMNAVRAQEMSNRFVSMGENLGASGQGLSADSAGVISRELGRFADKSRGLFNRRDMMNIMQHSADTGLLDFANNTDKILAYVKTTSKVVATLAKITADPDIKNNIQLLANMQRMGLDPMQALSGLSGMRMYARLGGTTIGAAAATHGAAGAAMYQGMGLLPGQGMLSGIYGAGVAGNSMGSGAVSPELSALLGGPSGMAQGVAAGQGAFMTGTQGPLILAAMLTQRNGRLAVDQAKVRGLLSGTLSYDQIIQQGQQNLNSVQNIAGFETQRPELMAQLMNQLGPTGVNYLQVQSAAAIRGQLGNTVSLADAMRAQGMDPNSANAFERRLGSPSYHFNERLQLQLTENANRSSRAQQVGGYLGSFGRDVEHGWNRFLEWIPGASYEDRARRRDLEQETARLHAAGRQDTRSEWADRAGADYWGRVSAGSAPGNIPGVGSSAIYTMRGMLNQFQRDQGFDTLKYRLRYRGGLTGWAAPALAPVANVVDALSGGLFYGNYAGAQEGEIQKFAGAFDTSTNGLTDEEYKKLQQQYSPDLRAASAESVRSGLNEWFATDVGAMRRRIRDDIAASNPKMYDEMVKNGTLDSHIVNLMKLGARGLQNDQSYAKRMAEISGTAAGARNRIGVSQDAMTTNTFNAAAAGLMKNYTGSNVRAALDYSQEDLAGAMQRIIRKVYKEFGVKDGPKVLQAMALLIAKNNGDRVAGQIYESDDFVNLHGAAASGLALLSEKDLQQFTQLTREINSDTKLRSFADMASGVHYLAASDRQVSAMVAAIRSTGETVDLSKVAVGQQYDTARKAFVSNQKLSPRLRKLAADAATNPEAEKTFLTELFAAYPGAGTVETPEFGEQGVGPSDAYRRQSTQMDRILEASGPALERGAKNFEAASERLIIAMQAIDQLTERLTTRDLQLRHIPSE